MYKGNKQGIYLHNRSMIGHLPKKCDKMDKGLNKRSGRQHSQNPPYSWAGLKKSKYYKRNSF